MTLEAVALYCLDNLDAKVNSLPAAAAATTRTSTAPGPASTRTSTASCSRATRARRGGGARDERRLAMRLASGEHRRSLPSMRRSRLHEHLEQSILQLVTPPGYRPIKPRVIAQRLNLPKDQAADVRRAVKRLVRAGKAGYSAEPSGAARRAISGRRRNGSAHESSPEPPTARRTASGHGSQAGNRVMGVFQRTQKGFGFVRLDRRRRRRPTKSKDIYIPAERTARRRHRRRGAGANSSRPRPRRARPARRDRRGRRAADAPVRRHVFRVGRRGLRAGRRHAVRPADLRGRSGREERPARRQGGHRDGPLPLAAARRRRA